MITVRHLQRMKGVVSLSALAKAAGIHPQALLAKVRRNSELRVDEAMAIERALREAGLQVLDANGENS